MTLHQGACCSTKPIHKAHAELAAKAKPAKRIPAWETFTLEIFALARRDHSQGANISMMAPPTAKDDITAAPSKAELLSKANNNAE